MVEMDITTPSTIPLPVLMFFITVTTMLVSVHMIALMISTCILPHIESMNAMQDLVLTLGTNDDQIMNDHNDPMMVTTPLMNDNHPSTTTQECYFWRTTFCHLKERCPKFHLQPCKNIDAQIWMFK